MAQYSATISEYVTSESSFFQSAVSLQSAVIISSILPACVSVISSHSLRCA